ncbi:hypothetical protein LCGC14_0568850 [marine sediment metagenome]|uniref:Uncharacterized protein n=1 Tax=marine sediment metagenome TaxID=412755 RepID=A0A0F9RQ22_9ZZZZ
MCCGDRGTRANPRLATCGTRTRLHGSPEEPSLLVTLNGLLHLEWDPRPRFPLVELDADLVNLRVWLGPVGPPSQCGFFGVFTSEFPGSQDFLYRIRIHASFPTTEAGFDLIHWDPSIGGYVGTASEGRSAIFNPEVSTRTARDNLASHAWYMNPETGQSAATVVVNPGLPITRAELEVPVPLRLETCIPGIAANRSLIEAPGSTRLLSMAEIEFNWTASIGRCPGDPGGGDSPPTACIACGGPLERQSGCRDKCTQCGLTTGGCG